MADEKLAMASLDEETRMSKVKKQYRALSRKYHPDKNGGDPEAVKKFVRLAGAYEKISGEEVTPYGDLYREICLDTVGVCLSEEEVDKQKYFFPRYLNSEKFGKASGGGLDEAEAEKKRRRLEEGIDKPKKKKKSKKKKKAKKAEGGEL
jgi:DnaJ-class molecular chaperone